MTKAGPKEKQIAALRANSVVEVAPDELATALGNPETIEKAVTDLLKQRAQARIRMRRKRQREKHKNA